MSLWLSTRMGIQWIKRADRLRYEASVKAAIARGDAVEKVGKTGLSVIIWRKK